MNGLRSRDRSGTGHRPWPAAASAFLHRRKELVAFLVGLALFAAGAFFLTRSHQRTAANPLEDIPPASGAEGARPAVGPAVGSSIGAHVERRRAALRKLAAASPRSTSWAVISFDAYREPDGVVAFLGGRGLHAGAFQQRVPVSGIVPLRVDLDGRRIDAALGADAGEGLARRLEKERADLERLLPDVKEAGFREVYEAEVDRLRKAVGVVRTRPATIFALVVRGRNDRLSAAARVPGVRLVDVADSPRGPPGTGGFYGILPDDVRIATFGRPEG